MRVALPIKTRPRHRRLPLPFPEASMQKTVYQSLEIACDGGHPTGSDRVGAPMLEDAQCVGESTLGVTKMMTNAQKKQYWVIRSEALRLAKFAPLTRMGRL